MKKLATSFVLILGLSFISFQSNASKGEKSAMQHASITENPWEVFKEVVYTYKTSNVKFIYTAKAEQEAFLEAAEEMKQKISEKSDEHAEEKLKRINQTVSVFTYLWKIKDELQVDAESIEDFEIPEVI